MISAIGTDVRIIAPCHMNKALHHIAILLFSIKQPNEAYSPPAPFDQVKIRRLDLKQKILRKLLCFSAEQGDLIAICC